MALQNIAHVCGCQQLASDAEPHLVHVSLYSMAFIKMVKGEARLVFEVVAVLTMMT
jgi:hypothetical protein